jgi:hypothetical protein
LSRSRGAIAFGVSVVLVALTFASLFPAFAPRTHFLAEDLPRQQQLYEQTPIPPGADPLISSLALADPSSRSHLAELRRGLATLLVHPLGYGLGNSGQTATRFRVPSQAGESFYLEVAADLGVLGLALWLAFSGLVLVRLFAVSRSVTHPSPRVAAEGMFIAMLALAVVAVVSDVWGSPWPSYVLWSFAGAALSASRRDSTPHADMFTVGAMR